MTDSIHYCLGKEYKIVHAFVGNESLTLTATLHKITKRKDGRIHLIFSSHRGYDGTFIPISPTKRYGIISITEA